MLASRITRPHSSYYLRRQSPNQAPHGSLAGQLGLETSPVSSQVVACDLLDKLDYATSQPWLLYPHERLGEREPFGRGEELKHISGRRRLFNFPGLPQYVRCTFEEERHRDLQDLRDVLQTARADAVPSLLIFLHLLKREPEAVAKRPLAHSEHHPTHPDPPAYVLIDGVGDLLDHRLFHDSSESLVLAARIAP